MNASISFGPALLVPVILSSWIISVPMIIVLGAFMVESFDLGLFLKTFSLVYLFFTHFATVEDQKAIRR